MTYTAQDLVAQARAVIEEIDNKRLLAMQADGTRQVRLQAHTAVGHTLLQSCA